MAKMTLSAQDSTYEADSQVSAKSKRANKARRAIGKAKIQSCILDYHGQNFDNSHAHFLQSEQKLDALLLLFKPLIPCAKRDKMMKTADVAINQIVGARARAKQEEEAAGSAEKVVCDLLDSLLLASSQLKELQKQKVLSAIVDDELSSLFAVLAKQGSNSAVSGVYGGLGPLPISIQLGAALLPLIAILKQMAEDLSAASSIRFPCEYQCASALAYAWFENTGKYPTLTHNSEGARTLFQKFMDTAVPRPPIGDDVLRCVIDELRETTGPEARLMSRRGETESIPRFREERERTERLNLWFRELLGVQ